MNMSNKIPKVSVIMAEYNTDLLLLNRAIKSILEQTFVDFEFIIVDDCGKNDLEKIVSNFDDARIKVYKNDKNRGLIYSLNRAIGVSRGEYLVRMDTDDYSYPNRIELQYEFIKKHPEYSVVGMRCEYYNGLKIYGVSSKKGEITRSDLLNSVPVIHPTVIMKKQDILNVGGYPDYKRCEDYALWIKLFIDNYRLYVMPNIGLQYTVRTIDYKKRKLKTRKDLFKLINNEYRLLQPSRFQIFKVKIKNTVAGVIPAKLMRLYHKNILRNDAHEKN